jgi:RNA polymerase sigma factor (sigma-70 family)
MRNVNRGSVNAGEHARESCRILLQEWRELLPEGLFDGLSSGEKRLERFLGCVGTARRIWCRVASVQMIASLRAKTDPEDALQDACLSAWRRSKSITIRRPPEFVSWFEVVLQRRLIETFRRSSAKRRGRKGIITLSLERDLLLLADAGKQRHAKILEPRSLELSAEEILITEETVERALQTLQTLDEVAARLLILVHGYCQSLADAGRDLSLTPAAVKHRLWRARRDARELFVRQGLSP